MNTSEFFANRVKQSVNPSEVFYILDAYLSNYPFVLGEELVQVARGVAESSLVLSITTDRLLEYNYTELRKKLPENKTWIASSGLLPIGVSLEDAWTKLEEISPSNKAGVSNALRFVGFDSELLDRLLTDQSRSEATQNQNTIEDELYNKWSEHQRSLREKRQKDIARSPIASKKTKNHCSSQQKLLNYPTMNQSNNLKSRLDR